MDVEVDHYTILGLPSGVEGSKLSEQEINKAYRSKARELHPDKRPGDPNAHANFLNLQTSYEVLKDANARKLCDDLLRVKREKLRHQEPRDSKRQRMTSDLEERERSYSAVDPGQRDREDDERMARKMREDMARISAMQSRKNMYNPVESFEEETISNKQSGPDGGGGEVDEDRVLKVSWEKIGQHYTAQKLREIFEEFGSVEDVVIKISKKRGSALVVMGSVDDASAATGKVLGYLHNPFLVLPRRTASPVVPLAERSEPYYPNLSNLAGAGYHAFEESVLEKMKKAAQRQKNGVVIM